MADETKQNLDGTTPVTPTPFDSHDQKVRAAHTYSREEGYQPADEAEPQEYPKAVDHVEKAGAPEGHLEPVLVNDEEEEAAHHEAKAEAEASAEKVADEKP